MTSHLFKYLTIDNQVLKSEATSIIKALSDPDWKPATKAEFDLWPMILSPLLCGKMEWKL